MIVDILLTYLQPIKLRTVVDMFEQYKYISTHVDSFPPKHLSSLPIVVVRSIHYSLLYCPLLQCRCALFQLWSPSPSSGSSSGVILLSDVHALSHPPAAHVHHQLLRFTPPPHRW
jgi:hypothetical protein